MRYNDGTRAEKGMVVDYSLPLRIMTSNIVKNCKATRGKHVLNVDSEPCILSSSSKCSLFQSSDQTVHVC